MKNTFLAVNKEYFGKGLQPIDILILSQVEEYNRNKCDCYLTNEQFASMFGTTLYAVKSSLDRLEELKYIKRVTNYVEGKGKANRQRVIKMVGCSSTHQNDDGRLKNENGRLKSKEWKVDSQPIKEKEKENIKYNITGTEENNIPQQEVDTSLFFGRTKKQSTRRALLDIEEEFTTNESIDLDW